MGLDLTFPLWGLACLAGAALALDAVSWPQGMWSRPFVAATLGGWLFGAPVEGCLIGICLEFALSREAAFGGARAPEAAPASFIAGAAIGLGGPGGGGPLAAAVLSAMVVGWVGAYSLSALRRINARIVAPEAVSGNPMRLSSRHRLCMMLDAARGGALVGVMLVPASLAVRLAGSLGPGENDGVGTTALLILAISSLGGVASRVLAPPKGSWAILAAGAAVGSIAVLMGVGR